MGNLAERIDRLHELREDNIVYEEQLQNWEQGLKRLDYLAERDESTFQYRKDSMQRGIVQLARLYGETFNDREKAQELITDLHNLTYDDVITETEEIKAKEQFKDVEENFLYGQWVEQLDEPKSVRVFSHYCVYVSLKGAANLLSEHTDGKGVLQYELGKTVQVDRQAIIALKEREDYDSTDPEWFISHILTVPGMWEVSQALLNQYSEQVRLEGATDTALPDTLYAVGPEVRDVRIRMRQAIHAYAAYKGSVKELSRRYNVPRRDLESELRNGALLRRHGGSRKDN